MHKSSALLVGFLLLASCSKVNHLTDTANNLDKNTASLSKNTKSVDNTSGTMYEQFRSKESEEARARKFHEIVDGHAAKAERFGTKSNNAVVYYEAFEFQLWTGSLDFDTRSKREAMFEDAANEFTRRMCDLYDVINTKKMSPTADIEHNNEEFAFYALAVGMHFEHDYQKVQSNKSGFSGKSFYDVVKRALTLEYRKQDMEAHEAILVQGINKEIMIELLKARIDMITALAVKNLTDKRKLSLFHAPAQAIKALLFKASFGNLGQLDIPETFADNNKETNDRVIELLDGARKTKEFLKSIGVAHKLEKNIYSVMQNLELSPKTEGDAKALVVQGQQKQQITELINTLLN
jgi:flagellar hook-basal body complex protein FliE